MKKVNFYIRLMLVAIFAILVFSTSNVLAANGLELYTPYTKITVSPGKSISYSIDVINNSDQLSNENISVRNVPRTWNHALTAGGYDIDKIAVLGGEKKTLTLKVDVPYHVKKGSYTFYINAGDVASLPVTVRVSTAGSNETELTCDQKNMEGTSKSSFSFKAVLKNRTLDKQQYALMAQAPKGWSVAIKPNYQQATSTEVEANGTKDITYEVKAPASVKAGTYKIPIKAVSGSTSAENELEVVITGTYELDLNTPNGLLSAKITAGSEKKVELKVSNDGSAVLQNVELSSSKPKNWEVTFEPQKITSLEPGKSEVVYATIKADKKAIPGDYVAKIYAKTPEADSSISFRMMVKTPMLMGWLGILIILIAIGGVVFLFKKYGRR